MDYPQLNLILGLLLIGGVAAWITASLYRREMPPRSADALFGAQMIVSLLCLLLAFGLYRSLVPMPVL